MADQRRQAGLHRPGRIAGEDLHLHIVPAADVQHPLIVLEGFIRLIDIDLARPAHQTLPAGNRLEQRHVIVEGPLVQRAQRRSRRHGLGRPARPDEAHQPGEGRGQIAPIDPKRPLRIQQPGRDLADHPRQGQGDAGAGGDAARIAEGTIAARRDGIEHRDLMAVALKIAGAADADDSGADDDDLHRRRVSMAAGGN